MGVEAILAAIAELSLNDLIPLAEKIYAMVEAKKTDEQSLAEAQVETGDAAIDAALLAKK